MKKIYLYSTVFLLASAALLSSCKSKEISRDSEKKEISKGPDGREPPKGRPGDKNGPASGDLAMGKFGPGPGGKSGGKSGGRPGNLPDGKPGEMPEGMPGPKRTSAYEPECSDSSAQSLVYTFENERGLKVTYHAKYIIDGKNVTYSAEDFAGGKVTVSAANEIAFLVINGGTLTLNNVSIEKTGDADEKTLDGDAYNFYGINNALVAVGKNSKMILNGVEVMTNALHANAVFATDGAEITVNDGITISSFKRGSRGFFASYGGSVVCKEGNVNITTRGNNSAALATDRGGGNITLLGKNNLLNTQANDSPCIYSTGNITASGVTGKAETAQTLVIEGLNNVNISDSTFTGARKGQGAIMIYQSFSGDASVGEGKLNIENCIFYNQYADDDEAMFYVTNTNALVNIQNCTFYAGTEEKSYGKNNYFVLCEENSDRHWGRSGMNGGQMTMTISGSNQAGLLKAAEKDSVITVKGETKNLQKDKSSKGKVSI